MQRSAPSPGASSPNADARPEKRVRLASVSSASSGNPPTEYTDSRRSGPPSPISTGSTIAVGTSQEAALIQSIEQGHCLPDDLDETRSLTDSIRQHIVDGGLRYHAYHAGKYLFPNDETEQYRDDLKHHLTLYLCDDNLFFAPVHNLLEQGAEVLDLGTGTGKWCIDCELTLPAP